MKQYCQTCGEATNYTSSPPRFCAACGEPFTKAATAAKPPKRPVPVQVETDETEEEIDTTPVVIPSQLKVRIEGHRRDKVTLGQIAFEQPPTDKFHRPSGPKISKKQFLKQFRDEAGGAPTQSIQVGGDGE